MNTSEAFDQSMIDKIVATAESDTVESRVANLEEEVSEIKGSIKTLLVDIRETMGVLENPFQNIQGIANISSGVITPKPSLDEMENQIPEPKEVKTEPDDEGLELIEDIPQNLIEKSKQVVTKLKKPDSKLVDPLSFYRAIVWSKDMVEKYDRETIVELVDIFSRLGYIPSDIKEILIKLIEILGNDSNLDGAVTDLYRLYHILNPEDPSLDSKVLDYVLNENDTVKNLCQRK